ncbi:MAG: response regulator [Parcubacteria group bacterium]|nr:response regulator [Parcubacteria group bacterium]|tara:strand:+ start:2974 stop:3345 length:372 start_codon:yes stop_codon:yes gene_type:complete
MAKEILLIEDDHSLARTLSQGLEANGYKVSLADNGKTGIEKAKDRPDLILLDIMLPDEDGTEILKKIKADEKIDDIPVVVLINKEDKETISKILDAGGKEYLIKVDWSIEEIISKIEKFFKYS